MPFAAAALAPAPRHRGIEGHAINPRRLLGLLPKRGYRRPELQQNVLQQVVLVLRRRRAATDHLQHQPKVLFKPAPEDRFAFQASEAGKPFDQDTLNDFLLQSKRYLALMKGATAGVVPPRTGKTDDAWANVGEAAMQALTNDQLSPILVHYGQLGEALRADNPAAFNTAMAWRRGERRRREGHESFARFDLSPQVQPSHAEGRPEQEIVTQLYAAIRELPKVDASLALMQLDGLSYQEMAEVLGISENYIGVKLTRIRKQLADQLKGTTDGIR